MTNFTSMKTFLLAMLIALAPFQLMAQESSVGEQSEILQIDINTADAQTIAEKLVGVGMVRAREIVAYREMYGSFQSLDELTAVKGVGPATVDKNRHLILIVKKD